MNKPMCNKCGHGLTFRKWSNRKPHKSEALALCENCGELWQIRYWKGIPTSDPYQVKPRSLKTVSINGRTSPQRKASIIAIYGSVQKFIDEAPLVCIALQSKS